MTDLSVRRLDGDEFEAFRSIRLEALREASTAFGSSHEDWRVFPDEEWRRRLDENATFVAFLDGAPVGLMGLIREKGAKTRHRATVAMVYVRANLRGQGVSGRLLDALTDYAREVGVRQLELVVSVENPSALKFYRRRGYVEIGRIPGALRFDDREVDEIVMARRIDL